MDGVIGLQHIGIPCQVLDKAIDFYEKLGFEVLGKFTNERKFGLQRVCFVRYGGLVLELYDGESAPCQDGAVNHFALDVTGDIDVLYQQCARMGLKCVSNGIHFLPFWENGIRYFIVEGPNAEKIELCKKI